LQKDYVKGCYNAKEFVKVFDMICIVI